MEDTDFFTCLASSLKVNIYVHKGRFPDFAAFVFPCAESKISLHVIAIDTHYDWIFVDRKQVVLLYKFYQKSLEDR